MPDRMWGLSTHTRADDGTTPSFRKRTTVGVEEWEWEPGDMTHYRVQVVGDAVVFFIGRHFKGTTWGAVFRPSPDQVGELGDHEDLGTRRPGRGYEYDLSLARFAAKLVAWPDKEFPEPEGLRARRQ